MPCCSWPRSHSERASPSGIRNSCSRNRRRSNNLGNRGALAYPLMDAARPSPEDRAMASRALMFRRCRKHQRHVLKLLDRKLAQASNDHRFFCRRRTRGESGKAVPRRMRTKCGCDSEQRDYHESGNQQTLHGNPRLARNTECGLGEQVTANGCGPM